MHVSVAMHAKVHTKLPERINKTKYPTDLQLSYFCFTLHTDECICGGEEVQCWRGKTKEKQIGLWPVIWENETYSYFGNI